MKKYLLLFLMIFIPLCVHAETCDSTYIKIESIRLINVNGVEEINEASVNGMKINLDLKMHDVGDIAEYELKVKNTSNEDFYINRNFSNLDTDYIIYEIADNNLVKAGKESIIRLKVTYKKEVPEEKIKNGMFSETNKLTLQLTNNNSSSLKNPNTGSTIIRIILILLMTCIIVMFVYNKSQNTKIVVLIIGAIILLPMTVYAVCKYEIEIESKIEIPVKEIIKYTLSYDGTKPITKIGEAIPNNVLSFKTPELVMDEWKNITYDQKIKPFYLKHKLDVNDIITESYVEFLITDELKTQMKEYFCYNRYDEEKCNKKYDNLVNGTYTIRGIDMYDSNGNCKNEYSDDGRCKSPFYENNIEVLKRAFNYELQPELCSQDSYGFHCYLGNIFADLDIDGMIIAGDFSDYECYVDGRGYSRCFLATETG